MRTTVEMVQSGEVPAGLGYAVRAELETDHDTPDWSVEIEGVGTYRFSLVAPTENTVTVFSWDVDGNPDPNFNGANTPERGATLHPSMSEAFKAAQDALNAAYATGEHGTVAVLLAWDKGNRFTMYVDGKAYSNTWNDDDAQREFLFALVRSASIWGIYDDVEHLAHVPLSHEMLAALRERCHPDGRMVVITPYDPMIESWFLAWNEKDEEIVAYEHDVPDGAPRRTAPDGIYCSDAPHYFAVIDGREATLAEWAERYAPDAETQDEIIECAQQDDMYYA